VSVPLHIEVSELADAQIREADAWWRINRLKAPNAIREELERASSLIAFQPGVGTRARNTALPGVRRLHIERIHYDIYYRVVGSPACIEIVAFWGSQRGSQSPI
jgi:plasmid stabilization system protein ParE